MADDPTTLFVITGLSIDDVYLAMGQPHPEQTPVGPFESREAAWEYAAWMQTEYGDGGGSVEVAPLHAPRSRDNTPGSHGQEPAR